MRDLGVKVVTGKELGVDGFSIQSLKADGNVAIFLGIGLGAVSYFKLLFLNIYLILINSKFFIFYSLVLHLFLMV